MQSHRDFSLEPDDLERLANLCGPFDAHLRMIELRLGVEIAARSGYAPSGLVTFLEAAQERSARRDQAVASGLMRTHPVHGERIEELRAHIRSVAPHGDQLPRLAERYARETQGRI